MTIKDENLINYALCVFRLSEKLFPTGKWIRFYDVIRVHFSATVVLGMKAFLVQLKNDLLSDSKAGKAFYMKR